MTIRLTRLGNPDPEAPVLTLIHGWAAENAIWEDWAQTHFGDRFQLVLMELPGFGQCPALPEQPADQQMQAWLDSLWQGLPEQTHLLGWSLGGMLAQRLAWRAQQPESAKRIQSLICLASTPRFVQNDGWRKAVSPKLMSDFIHALAIETSRVVKQFWNLQLQGSDNARPLVKQLKAHLGKRHLPSYQGLMQGLILLRDLDNRDLLPALTLPTLWLFGENDPLIPVSLRQTLPELQPHAQIEILPGAGHMPFFSHPEATARAINGFIH
ncbi:alpha/beta fold hydrolase [Hydrogenovibrio halophilus]|uniref:alpha/beta fold hydrolase n=1 Tax=Hydrogenovibrio halophilus TaxID=373391 RepID=UPI00037A65E4|nr:alpha/beta fold hydrolase [Hydrogenovibrio halophilus]